MRIILTETVLGRSTEVEIAEIMRATATPVPLKLAMCQTKLHRLQILDLQIQPVAPLEARRLTAITDRTFHLLTIPLRTKEDGIITVIGTKAMVVEVEEEIAKVEEEIVKVEVEVVRVEVEVVTVEVDIVKVEEADHRMAIMCLEVLFITVMCAKSAVLGLKHTRFFLWFFHKFQKYLCSRSR